MLTAEIIFEAFI